MGLIKIEQASLFTIITSLKYKFALYSLKVDERSRSVLVYQFVIFKPLSYCFEETIGFNVKALFVRGLSKQVIKQNNFKKRPFSSMRRFMDWKLKTDITTT